MPGIKNTKLCVTPGESVIKHNSCGEMFSANEERLKPVDHVTAGRILLGGCDGAAIELHHQKK